MTECPLVVDLDKALLQPDLLLETRLLRFGSNPLRLLFADARPSPSRASSDGAHELTPEVDVSALLYEQAVLELARTERSHGRQVVLITSEHCLLAERIAEHLGLFDAVIAAHGSAGDPGLSRRDVLVKAFGERGFDYAGTSSTDLVVWRAARNAFLVNTSRTTERNARAFGNVAAVLRRSPPGIADWTGAFRLHQWLKNLLLFVPIFAAQRYLEGPLLVSGLLAFLCFGLCASGVYVLNDLLDLGDDRRHARKSLRPFASGRLRLRTGLAMFPALLTVAFALALAWLPPAFSVVLAMYLGLSMAYALELKRRMAIDVIALASLYTIRIIAGAVAVGITVSFWMLAFSTFMFLSLALVKRYAELFQARAQGQSVKIHGRGYYPDDLSMIASLGAAAGYIAVLVLALYINDASTARLYQRPEVIWLACPLLLAWVSRVWMLAHRGEMNEDPVIFAVSDWKSLVNVALLVFVFLAAA